MSKKIVLMSSDGDSFELPLYVALQCGTIKEMNDDGCADDVIPVPITSNILSKVIDFCSKHAERPNPDDGDGSSSSFQKELSRWDREFVKVTRDTLRLLMLAANYLDVKDLLNATSQVVADKICPKISIETKIKQPGIQRGNQFSSSEPPNSNLGFQFPHSVPTMSKKIVLKSSDGESFELPLYVALQCGMIKEMNDDGCADGVIPVPITSNILSMVIDFCRKHAEWPNSDDGNGSSSSFQEELYRWDREFVKVDRETLCLLILAANYLDAKALLNATCQVVADAVCAKTSIETHMKCV